MPPEPRAWRSSPERSRETAPDWANLIQTRQDVDCRPSRLQDPVSRIRQAARAGPCDP